MREYTPGDEGSWLRCRLRPVASFFHADLRKEERLRKEFARVHVCRRFSMPL